MEFVFVFLGKSLRRVSFFPCFVLSGRVTSVHKSLPMFGTLRGFTLKTTRLPDPTMVAGPGYCTDHDANNADLSGASTSSIFSPKLWEGAKSAKVFEKPKGKL